MAPKDQRTSDPPAPELAANVRETAFALGADLVGTCGVDVLQAADPKAWADQELEWRQGAVSAIIIAVAHPESRPELDWWSSGITGGAEGNRKLIAIVDGLGQWFSARKIETRPLPYQATDGGIFLKDAAVTMGLGVIGKNNLLVTREYGTRVRLRALLVKTALPNADATGFNPCPDCPMPCKAACPQQAFSADGDYQKSRCYVQMKQDEENAERIGSGSDQQVRYCRLCELTCPVGKQEERP